jgi:hypothetical protein
MPATHTHRQTPTHRHLRDDGFKKTLKYGCTKQAHKCNIAARCWHSTLTYQIRRHLLEYANDVLVRGEDVRGGTRQEGDDDGEHERDQ